MKRFSIFPKYSLWIPLGEYMHDYAQRIVFVRKNLNTGMMQFKTKRIGAYSDRVLPLSLINVSEQWNKITGIGDTIR